MLRVRPQLVYFLHDLKCKVTVKWSVKLLVCAEYTVAHCLRRKWGLVARSPETKRRKERQRDLERERKRESEREGGRKRDSRGGEKAYPAPLPFISLMSHTITNQTGSGLKDVT